MGHNYSIFLIETNENGRLQLRGGAGGATAVGGAVALWPFSLFFILPIAVFFLFGVGYASLATLSVPITAIFIFLIRGSLGLSSWVYIMYGIGVELIIIWALGPNIKRIINGTERIVGWRANRLKKTKKTKLCWILEAELANTVQPCKIWIMMLLCLIFRKLQ